MKRVQAKDVPESPIVAALLLCAGHVGVYDDERAMGVWTWQSSIVDMMPSLAMFPEKVLRRRLGSMARRGIIHGCDCGCRGDWHIPFDTGDYDRCPCGSMYKRKATS